MKQYILMLCMLCAVVLGGCGEAAVTELVTDSIPASAAAGKAYEIAVSVPAEAQNTVLRRGTECVYRPEDGRFEIVTKQLLAESVESAVHQLSGYAAEELSVSGTTRFSMPEYRFAWFVPDGEDGWVCRAAMLQDGKRFYCVLCRVRESAEENCGQLAMEVFSTVGLFTDEFA